MGCNKGKKKEKDEEENMFWFLQAHFICRNKQGITHVFHYIHFGKQINKREEQIWKRIPTH